MKRLLRAAARGIWRGLGSVRRPFIRKIHEHANLVLSPLEEKIERVAGSSAELTAGLTAVQVDRSTEHITRLIRDSSVQTIEELQARIAEVNESLNRTAELVLQRIASVNLTLASLIREQARCQYLVESLQQDLSAAKPPILRAG